MPAKNTPQSKRSTAKVAAQPKAKAETGAFDQIKGKLGAAVEGMRETSRENMLAGLGLIARVRQQRNERMDGLVEEGKRFEPEVKQAIEDLKSKIRIKGELKEKFDLGRFKLDAKRFDRDAIKARLDDRMATALHRMGLATRKEVDVLARDVAKLTEMEAA